MNDSERRNASDRRMDDELGPPSGWRERRKSTERRIPQIEEQALSEEEWSLYFAQKVDVKSSEATPPETETPTVD